MSLCNEFRIASRSSAQFLSARRKPTQVATCRQARTYHVFSSCRHHRQVNISGFRQQLTRHSPASARLNPRGNIRFLQHDAALRNRAFIALGSNMGDRVAEIEKACKEMNASGNMRIVRTSSLYETKAMYVLDQDTFVNGACEVCYIVFAGIQS